MQGKVAIQLEKLYITTTQVRNVSSASFCIRTVTLVVEQVLLMHENSLDDIFKAGKESTK